MNLLAAMARQEGFLVHGTRPQRNNNPGDLEFHPWMLAFGATGGDPRFAIFATVEQGYSAFLETLNRYYRGKTVQEMLDDWAPPKENNTNIYLQHVCEWVPCKPTDVIDPFLVMP